MEEEEYLNEPKNVIIDSGSGYTKAGLSSELDPSAVFPTIVGYPKYYSGMTGGDKKEFWVGPEAVKKGQISKIYYPIEHGEFINWDDIEKIWFHIFINELRVAPEEQNVLITDSSYKPKESRENIAQIMFETFGVHGLYIDNPAVLSLYSVGKYTGVGVDLGDGGSQFVPTFEGFALSHAYIKYEFGGRQITEYLVNCLQSYGYNFYNFSSWKIANEIKEKGVYFLLDLYEDNIEPFDYELRDGNHIIIKDPEIRCLKSYFKPDLYQFMKYGFDLYNIQQICYNSIIKCDIDIRKDLYNNIVLSGGNSMFNGLKERFEKNLKDLAPEYMKEKVKVIASPERKYAFWIGGRILSSISTFENIMTTKDEYEENGAKILLRKCFF